MECSKLSKNRTTVPERVRVAVLKEFNHRCALCGADRPQIHHIDEDPSNNENANLIPLCPNCHLTDQHNPTQPIEPAKLALFRRFKDPAIMLPQFNPLFTRMRFLVDLDVPALGPERLSQAAEELVEFVAVLEMGAFYSAQLDKLIGRRETVFIPSLEDPMARVKRSPKEYLSHFLTNRGRACELVVELLRYQAWSARKP